MLARLTSRVFTSSTIIPQASLFDSLNFPPFVHRIFESKSFTAPTPIQSESWPLAIEGKDIIGIAQTGSGKTLAYSIPMLLSVIKTKNNILRTTRNQPPVSMIVLPTRELCKQVSEEYCKFAYAAGIKVATVFGGENKRGQIFHITPGIHTVIGTPGRMMDLMNDEILKLDDVNFVVLDEADLMLDMGFEDDIRRILSAVKLKRQTLMFTATWPREIQSLAGEFLNKPTKIMIGDSELTMNPDISHKFSFSSEHEKKQICLDLITKNEDGKILIFTNTKKEADELNEYLGKNGVKSDALHSDRGQVVRNAVIREFKNNTLNVMIATDVASRGLDIKNVNTVINYSMPGHFDDYIHRVGRTARAGNSGEAVSFVNHKSNKTCLRRLKHALKEIGIKVPKEFDDIISLGGRNN